MTGRRVARVVMPPVALPTVVRATAPCADHRRAHNGPRGQAFLTAEISISRVILSETSTPPVSSAALKVMP